MNITSSNTMIFAREFNGKTYYRAGIINKKQDGEYDRAYIDVRFPKDTKIQDKTKIAINKGFLTFSKGEDDKTYFRVVILEYKEIGTIKEEPKEEDPYAKFGSQITVEDLDKNMDLPF